MIRRRICLLALGLSQGTIAADTGVIRVRTDLPYPEAMSSVQHAIREAGYSLSFIQPVDRGLRRRGIDTPPYRVPHVWDERSAEDLLAAHPELAAHLPLRITLQVVEARIELSALRPTLFATDPAGRAGRVLSRWEADLESIIAAARKGPRGAGPA